MSQARPLHQRMGGAADMAADERTSCANVQMPMQVQMHPPSFLDASV